MICKHIAKVGKCVLLSVLCWGKLQHSTDNKLHFLEIALDGVIVGSILVGLLWATAVGTSTSACTTLAIERLSDLVESFHESLSRGFDASYIIGRESRAHISYLGLQVTLLLGSDLIAQFSDILFSLIGCAISLVTLFNLFLA